MDWPTCKTCRHWTDTQGSVATPPEGFRSCVLITGAEHVTPNLIARTAYGYDLFTHENFGCSLHEQISNPTASDGR